MGTVRVKVVHSLKSLCIDYSVKNLAMCCSRNMDTLSSLPASLKDRMLHKFLTTPFYWRNINFKDVLAVLTHNKTTKIDMTSVTVDNEILKVLEQCCLHTLYLTKVGQQDVTDDALIKLFSCTKYLQSLRISYCPSMNDRVLESLAENCPNLAGLDVGGCSNVTDKGLEALSCLENLTWLTFSGTSVTNKGIEKLVIGPSGSKIKELRMANCGTIDEAVLRVVADHCPNIAVLVFCNYNNPFDDFTLTTTQKENLKNLKQVTWAISW